MKLNFKLDVKKEGDKCEHCGGPILGEPYILEVKGEKHYFCCSHCADAWKKEHG